MWQPKTVHQNTSSVETTIESEKGVIVEGMSDDFVAHMDLVFTPVVFRMMVGGWYQGEIGRLEP